VSEMKFSIGGEGPTPPSLRKEGGEGKGEKQPYRDYWKGKSRWDLSEEKVHFSKKKRGTDHSVSGGGKGGGQVLCSTERRGEKERIADGLVLRKGRERACFTSIPLVRIEKEGERELGTPFPVQRERRAGVGTCLFRREKKESLVGHGLQGGIFPLNEKEVACRPVQKRGEKKKRNTTVSLIRPIHYKKRREHRRGKRGKRKEKEEVVVESLGKRIAENKEQD